MDKFNSSMENKVICPFISQNRGNLLEFSVIFTDRATNLMSLPFQECMRDISSMLKQVYNADSVALIPGSGTFAMEATARQFATDKKVMVLRNGFFSFRWNDIFNVCKIPSEEVVVKAQCTNSTVNPPMEPILASAVVDLVETHQPAVLFAAQVETSTGIMLSEEYIKTVSDAVHKVGGIMVLDSIAAGTLWVDMKALGVDVVISAPQKGWSGPACCGIVLMNSTTAALAKGTVSTSFSCNLNKWLDVMEAYENGGFMYYTTLPTDAIMVFRQTMHEILDDLGMETAKTNAGILGDSIRKEMEKNGFISVAAPGFQAPTVVVVYCKSNDAVATFKEQGIQVAGGVPFKCDEPEGLKTFRIGLFGVDKLKDPSKCAQIFTEKLNLIMAELI